MFKELRIVGVPLESLCHTIQFPIPDTKKAKLRKSYSFKQKLTELLF